MNKDNSHFYKENNTRGNQSVNKENIIPIRTNNVLIRKTMITRSSLVWELALLLIGLGKPSGLVDVYIYIYIYTIIYIYIYIYIYVYGMHGCVYICIHA